MSDEPHSGLGNTGAWTCASCAAETADPALEGWHLFEDGMGEEHALCADCTRVSPDAGRA
jgi:hypothetical protein